MAKFYDPFQNYLEGNHNPIDGFFNPRSIAIVGATEKNPSVARTILNNLITQGYKGKIYPVNPKYPTLLNLPCFPSLEAIDHPVDLVIIVTPAKTVPPIVESAVKLHVPSIIIISAGFKEAGQEGIALENKIVKTIQNTNTRIIGPNCLGLMNPHIGLNATFSSDIAKKGNIAFISQSGAMCTSVLDWSLRENVGFSAFVSIGSMADVQFGDLIQYFGSDPKTEMILVYMESIGDPRVFLSSAKKVALTKPIVLIKAGRTQAAQKAAASHTGSMAGSDDAFDAAIRRVGVLRVDRIEELFDMTLTLSKQPIPKGPHLTIITNAGGPAVLATDGAVLNGAKMAELEQTTIDQLSEFLPAAWSHSNPVDLLGDADEKAYARTIPIICKDKNTDGILIVLTPQDMTKPLETAQALAQLKDLDKPIFASFMGGDKLKEGIEVLNHSNIPNFMYPDEAAKTFGKIYHHQEEIKALYETPAIREKDFDPKMLQERIQFVDAIIHQAIEEKRTYLTEFESKKILQAYSIPTVETIVAETKEKAVHAAEKIGFPVVLKLHSDTITHKSDVGGVKLNIQTKEAVIEAYETIKQNLLKKHQASDFGGVTVQKMINLSGTEILIGSLADSQFGPVMMFGTGGVLVEVFKDYALELPPLNATLAKRMIEKTKISKVLKGVRNKKGIDFALLEKIMINFSKLILEHPMILECDINPLLASHENIIALDARFVIALDKKEIVQTAMRPYPTEYISKVDFKEDKNIIIRPIRLEDEPKIIAFHHEISETRVKKQYLEPFSLKDRINHQRLIHICSVDYQNEMRFVAVNTKEEIIGVTSYQKFPNSDAADFRLTIVDRAEDKGLDEKLLVHLISIAKKEKISRLHGALSKENTHLIELCKNLGFSIKDDEKGKPIVYASMNLHQKAKP